MNKLSLLLTLAVSITASSLTSGQIESVGAERSDPKNNRSSIKLNWELAKPGAIAIYYSEDPEASIEKSMLLAEGITASDFETADFPGKRVYFTLVPDEGEAKRVAPRLLPLQGGRNFRDIGGYSTTDGRTVKWGQVFRSGVMHGITDADYRFLDQLEVGTIVDFRSTDERAVEPTNWRAGDADYIARDYVDEGANDLFASMMSGDATATVMRSQMSKLYHEIAYQQAPAYTVMFDELAGTSDTFAYNCSAGKDRAGIATALILTVLGVNRDEIIHDYSLSDDYVDYMAEFTSEDAESNPNFAVLSQIPRELLAPLMASYPEYIEAAFEHLESEHGSVMNFIQSELKVTDEEVAAIRNRLLETVH
ncbi:MAG: tyrosine-protein phosphatase [Pseudomonadales bacterium]|nr:tyrosine-protein phosphatase [Pseudomonadales bacterium]